MATVRARAPMAPLDVDALVAVAAATLERLRALSFPRPAWCTR